MGDRPHPTYHCADKTWSDLPVCQCGETMREVDPDEPEHGILSDIPLYGNGLRHLWKPGERVEYVMRHGDLGTETRPGVVVAIDEELRRHEFLRVRFDDGEERRINPDVMRHEKGSRS